jgi:hypothetical protein
VNWSETARLAGARAACALLNGGTLCLYAGKTQVAELRFADPAFHGDKLATLAPEESAEGSKDDLDGFAAKAPDGSVVATGTVGRIGSGADAELKALRIPRGARVEIESLHFVPGA